MPNNEFQIASLRTRLNIIEDAINIVSDKDYYTHNANECLWALCCISDMLRNRIVEATNHEADNYTNPKA